MKYRQLCMLTIQKITHEPNWEEFEIIIKASLEEGFNFLLRLKNEWIKGTNCFNKEGELEALITIRMEKMEKLEESDMFMYFPNLEGRG